MCNIKYIHKNCSKFSCWHAAEYDHSNLPKCMTVPVALYKSRISFVKQIALTFAFPSSCQMCAPLPSFARGLPFITFIRDVFVLLIVNVCLVNANRFSFEFSVPTFNRYCEVPLHPLSLFCNMVALELHPFTFRPRKLRRLQHRL